MPKLAAHVVDLAEHTLVVAAETRNGIAPSCTAYSGWAETS
jgi:hypothetical protein